MASRTAESASLTEERKQDEDGPYILRPLLADIELRREDWKGDVKINCVDFYNGNLYIGTTASEVLHFVQIPSEPNDTDGRPVYIPASRLSPVSLESKSSPSPNGPGVQEILLLPRIGKACILCNSTAAFYTLPELSPVSGISVVRNCNWIGGVNLDEIVSDGIADDFGATDATILLSLKSKIQVVRLADKVLEAPKVTFAGSILSVRRDSIACVADSRAYALLDIHRRLTIPLMSISTIEDSSPGAAETFQILDDVTETNAQHGQLIPPSRSPGHSRSLSGISVSSTTTSLHTQPDEHPLPPAPGESLPFASTADSTFSKSGDASIRRGSNALRPHIVSPSREEFLLVIGTRPSEPGVGMFVSLDGEPTRATIQFDRYPEQIVVDGSNLDFGLSQSGLEDQEDSHIIASICKSFDAGSRYGIEIQHVNAGQEANPRKYWLEALPTAAKEPYGLRTLLGRGHIRLDEIVSKLSQKRFKPFVGPMEASASSLKSVDSRTAFSFERLSQEKELFERDDSQDDDNLPEGWETLRTREGEDFARRLATFESGLAVWNGNRIWWAIRNPLIIQLDCSLDATFSNTQLLVDRQSVSSILNAIRSRDARNELEFLTLDYLKQKAGLLLLISVLSSIKTQKATESDLEAIEELLVDSKLDVRVVLSLIPGIRNDIIEGRRGIWIYGGVKEVADSFLRTVAFETSAKLALQNLDFRVTCFLRRFLAAWRNMKGFGSVPDEKEVSRTVDATLLMILLELDQRSPGVPGRGRSVKTELNDLVDGGVDCFDRAVDILESYGRLFLLSRLYQSRKMAGDVLATWKRMIEGEEDSMNEFRDGEQRVKDYLSKISSQALIQEYGVWLANRNPRLGVQVFAEDHGRAPRFSPEMAVQILRAEAPDAVKHFLEHLVFDKGLSAYVGELLEYYLDVVLEDLKSSQQSRAIVIAAYDAYKALKAPKPTYQHFLEENAPPDSDVWKSRLRLLQLLGGSHHYDTAAIAHRVGSLPGDLLVPEIIILAGRQCRHEEALRLLVHKLGDYDTAVAYCLRGGSSVYSHGGARQGAVINTREPKLQRQLFQAVLREFLRIGDLTDRVEQTGALLERFSGWFDVQDVLDLIPDSWSVEVVAGFLIGALRNLVREKHEIVMTRALSGAENLRINYDLVAGMAKKGPSIEAQN
ncbi:Vacuolar sorting protein 39/Transforming growth factor beta receptor-associated domain 2 [Moelleriella libera RCEF 2490]|uniref:Vacuolar sorting protein 39/Transforming growth factor beta receptor-associated domain 2 n=1 Tax=Moelleriella libera RCEF 2490 TaxID=1081109 RepID=A0A168F1M9_9HYPO|nr:Vacuolar sorting protein 39/Transforming growth factor beta receptor-associated domain 2 [Moelleriella libera RCEF 2490]